jgi:hypothetical protein
MRPLASHQTSLSVNPLGPSLGGCHHPDCPEAGLYRAPKSRQRLNEYYWFCLAHVREYNSAWDYCAGFGAADIEAMVRAAACWERPTWRLGHRPAARLDAAMAAFAAAFGDSASERPRDNRSQQQRRQSGLDKAEAAALAVFGLDRTATPTEIKACYKRLVKRYHPDANGGDKGAEERLKVINQAYSSLRTRAPR